MTLTQSLTSWYQPLIGKYVNVDWNPTNKGFGAQCWDAAASWSIYLGLPVINTGDARGRWPGWAGNMADTFPQNPDVAAAYTLLPPTTKGVSGDILVWDDSFWYYPATHVAVLIEDRGTNAYCVSQNSTPSRADNPYPGLSTGPMALQELPKQGLLGIIRPKIGQVTITPASDSVTVLEWSDMASEKEVQDAVYKELMSPRSQQALKDAFHGELGARRSIKRLQGAIWTQVGGERGGKLVSMWRDAVDTNTILRLVLDIVKDLAKKVGSPTPAGVANVDKLLDEMGKRLTTPEPTQEETK